MPTYGNDHNICEYTVCVTDSIFFFIRRLKRNQKSKTCLGICVCSLSAPSRTGMVVMLWLEIVVPEISIQYVWLIPSFLLSSYPTWRVRRLCLLWEWSKDGLIHCGVDNAKLLKYCMYEVICAEKRTLCLIRNDHNNMWVYSMCDWFHLFFIHRLKINQKSQTRLGICVCSWDQHCREQVWLWCSG